MEPVATSDCEVNKQRSPYCAGLEWTPGSLNDSTYRAFTKFAAWEHAHLVICEDNTTPADAGQPTVPL